MNSFLTIKKTITYSQYKDEEEKHVKNLLQKVMKIFIESQLYRKMQSLDLKLYAFINSKL